MKTGIYSTDSHGGYQNLPGSRESPSVERYAADPGLNVRLAHISVMIQARDRSGGEVMARSSRAATERGQV